MGYNQREPRITKEITVLNKGAKERTNLKTNTADALKNYKGHGVIWFQVF